MSSEKRSPAGLMNPRNLLIGGAILVVLGGITAGALALAGGKSSVIASADASRGFGSTDTKPADAAPNVKEQYKPGKSTDMPAPKTTESKNTGNGADNTVANANIKSLEIGTDRNPLNVIAYGSPTAPVTIIEYGSFSCPHCAEFDKDQFPQIKAAYIDKGLVRLVFRPYSRNGVDVYAGLLVACLQPDRRKGMVDMLFRQQTDWVPYDVPEDQAKGRLLTSLKEYGRNAGLSDQAVDQCLSNKQNEAWLQATMAAGNQQWSDAGGDPNEFGTPTFFIRGKKYNNMEFADWKKLLDPMVTATN